MPVKYEHVVFCSLSPLQLALYRLFITSPDIKRLLRGVGSQPLKAINILQKLCNHPDLLNLPDDLPGCEAVLPPDYPLKGRGASSRVVNCAYSGKFLVLERWLAWRWLSKAGADPLSALPAAECSIISSVTRPIRLS